MPTKEQVCYKLLQTYGILIDGPEEIFANVKVKSLPKRNDEETFLQWKKRVFKENVAITVYRREDNPHSRTKMATLCDTSLEDEASHVSRIFDKHKRALRKIHTKKTKEAVDETLRDIKEKTENVPRLFLEEKLEDNKDTFHPALIEFLKKLISGNITDNQTIIEDLLSHLDMVLKGFDKHTRKNTEQP